MYKTIAETTEFCLRLKDELASVGGKQVEAAVAPPFTSLSAAVQALRGSFISVAAQDVFWAESGAYTGEISPKMLADVGCRFVIVGHSERRQYFHETDDSVNKKAAGAIKEGLVPILCLGETLTERQGGSTFAVVERQTREGLRGLAVKDPEKLVIAYEPVWAIGTGQTATPNQAQEVQAFIRKLVGEIFSPPLAQGIRILYGGSVKPENIGELMAMNDVDGALVGGASLEAKSFAQIVRGSISR
jgi:triosephosphate isomerase